MLWSSDYFSFGLLFSVFSGASRMAWAAFETPLLISLPVHRPMTSPISCKGFGKSLVSDILIFSGSRPLFFAGGLSQNRITHCQKEGNKDNGLSY